MRNCLSKRGGRESMANVLVEKLADRLRVKREAPTAAARLSSVRGAKPRRLRCFSQWNSSEPKEGGRRRYRWRRWEETPPEGRGRRSVVVCGIVGIGQEFDALVGLLHSGWGKVGVRDNGRGGRRCFTAQKSRGWLAKEGRGGSIRGSKTTRLDSKN